MRRIFQNMRFMVLWVLGCVVSLYAGLLATVIISVGSSVAAMFIWTARNREPDGIGLLIFSVVVYSLVGLVIGTLLGLAQKGVLQQHTDEYWQGWIPATIAGTMIGVNAAGLLLSQQLATHVNLLELPGQEQWLLYLAEVVIIPLGCIGIAQTPIVWRYAHGAWVWILANVVAGMVLVSLMVALVSGTLGAVVAIAGGILVVSVAPGIVTGFAMVWLLLFNGKRGY